MSAVVMELKKELAALNARLSNDEVGAFRSCLCAMATRLQSEEAAATLSLAEWWQWLDDEGYERERFAAALRHICQSSLSEPAWTELQSDVHCMQARPEGLPELCQHVQERFKTLASTMERLEACAQAEQNALEATAGGMSKKGAVITGVSVYFGGQAISGIVAGVIIRRSQKRLEAQIKPAFETTHQDAVVAEKKEDAKINHTQQRLTEDANHIEKADEREIKETAESNFFKKDYYAYSKDINAKFKAHICSDDFGLELKPLFTDATGKEHYILQYHKRDMVKAVVKGQEFIFYKSTGLAGKDWKTEEWYPVGGIGSKKGWINKFDGAQNYFGARELKQVNAKLVELSKSKLFTEANYFDVGADKEEIRQQLNEGMNAVINNGEDSRAMKAEMFKKVFPMIVKDRYPKAMFNLEKLVKDMTENPRFGGWAMRGITEDHYELKLDLRKQMKKAAKDLIDENLYKGMLTSPESIQRLVSRMQEDFDRQLSLGSDVHDFLAKKQLRAEAMLVEDVQIVVTDHVAQLESRAIDAAEQKVKTAVDSKLADVVREEEEQLITDTKIRSEDLVRKGELDMEKKVVILKDAAIEDVRVAEDGKRLV